MKTMKQLCMIAFMVMLFTNQTSAQQEEPTFYLTVTTHHWNMNLPDFDEDKWVADEKEYFDKVIRKNEYILAANAGMHYLTDDNTEFVRVYLFKSWDDIQKGIERISELEKQAWPDDNARKAFLKKLDSYFVPNHSDEIYVTMPGTKQMSGPLTKGQLFYVRHSHFAFPENGTEEEFNALNKEYVMNVIHKNELIKGYYPHAHAWGSDRTEFLEAFVIDSAADLPKVWDRNQELFRAHWDTEAKRKAFDDKMGKYFTQQHSDRLYSVVPELQKESDQ